ncbi:hypothetical protein ZIOFF_058383 [Zingiber officinale]|uniref:Protein FAR1-RELATED SEQUENCE n=1 Tax=Zingiber officinale TaxID=94328 RepID=A0A8J5F892_ZINOF|nr:hypothetical protein ZIOFF_058383 [Zingiber officinale]
MARSSSEISITSYDTGNMIFMGLVFADVKAIKDNSIKLGAGEDLYVLFAGVLTMRPWQKVVDPSADHLVIKGNQDDRAELQNSRSLQPRPNSILRQQKSPTSRNPNFSTLSFSLSCPTSRSPFRSPPSHSRRDLSREALTFACSVFPASRASGRLAFSKIGARAATFAFSDKECEALTPPAAISPNFFFEAHQVIAARSSDFEFRHVIKVLIRLKVIEVPKNYIIDRWRKDIKRGYQSISNIYDDYGCDGERHRYNILTPLIQEVQQLGAKNDDNCSVLVEILKDTKEKLIAGDLGHSRVEQLEKVSTSGAKMIHSPLKVRSRGRPPTKRKQSKIEQIVKKSIANARKKGVAGSDPSNLIYTRQKGDASGRSKQSRSEKKSRRAMLKPSMKPVPGVNCVTLKKSKNDDEEVDEAGVEPKDIELVMTRAGVPIQGKIYMLRMKSYLGLEAAAYRGLLMHLPIAGETINHGSQKGSSLKIQCTWPCRRITSACIALLRASCGISFIRYDKQRRAKMVGETIVSTSINCMSQYVVIRRSKKSKIFMWFPGPGLSMRSKLSKIFMCSINVSECRRKKKLGLVAVGGVRASHSLSENAKVAALAPIFEKASRPLARLAGKTEQAKVRASRERSLRECEGGERKGEREVGQERENERVEKLGFREVGDFCWRRMELGRGWRLLLFCRRRMDPLDCIPKIALVAAVSRQQGSRAHLVTSGEGECVMASPTTAGGSASDDKQQWIKDRKGQRPERRRSGGIKATTEKNQAIVAKDDLVGGGLNGADMIPLWRQAVESDRSSTGIG